MLTGIRVSTAFKSTHLDLLMPYQYLLTNVLATCNNFEYKNNFLMWNYPRFLTEINSMLLTDTKRIVRYLRALKLKSACLHKHFSSIFVRGAAIATHMTFHTCMHAYWLNQQEPTCQMPCALAVHRRWHSTFKRDIEMTFCVEKHWIVFVRIVIDVEEIVLGLCATDYRICQK